MSEIQVFRNFETAIRRAGFTIDWSEPPSQNTAHKGDTWYRLDDKSNGGCVVVAGRDHQVRSRGGLWHQLRDGQSGDTAGVRAGASGSSKDAQNESLKIRIEGHTDSVGAKPANQALSEKRGQAVMGWLIAKGIDAGRLTARGFGDTKALADNGTEDGRGKNRRVELAKM